MTATVTQVSEVGPMSYASRTSVKIVDMAPIVLWSDGNPGLVLRYEISTKPLLGHVSQTFEPMDGRSHGPFPVTASDTLSPFAKSGDSLDVYAVDQVMTADLDGNGSDELILFRQSDAIEVYAIDRVLFKAHGSGLGAPRPKTVTRVCLATGEVLLALYQRPPASAELESGGGNRFALVRIDGRGAGLIALTGKHFQPKSILGVGALNRPGSSGIDELLVLSMPGADDKEVQLSRHAPDGRLLAPPRRLYDGPPPWHECAFAFLAQSGRAVAFDGYVKRAYFFAPDKPAGWLRSVDLSAVACERNVTLLGAMDPGQPKLLLDGQAGVYLVDEEGKSYGYDRGALIPRAGLEPLYRYAAAPEYHNVQTFPSPSADAFLSVEARKEAVRKLTDAELTAAAERFLPVKVWEEKRRGLEPDFDNHHEFLREDLMAEERKKKNVTAAVRTVEAWKRLLPDSYAEWLELKQRNLRSGLEILLLETPYSDCQDYREYDAYHAWRESLREPARTTFTLVRRGQPIQFEVPGAPPSVGGANDLSLPEVSFRAVQDGVTVVLALERQIEPGKKKSGFFAIRFNGGR